MREIAATTTMTAAAASAAAATQQSNCTQKSRRDGDGNGDGHVGDDNGGNFLADCLLDPSLSPSEAGCSS